MDVEYIFILTVIFASRDIMASSCPHHVTEAPYSYTTVHNHICYMFVNKELYWSKARDQCWDLGGEMLIIDNPETMSFIQKKLNSPELSWDRNGVWLGATKSSGKWRWTNGQIMNYTNWAPSQPSNVLGILSVEDCSQMRQEDGWKWHDILCGSLNFRYNYVCQFFLNKPGMQAGRVSSSASEETGGWNDNYYILIIIISISTSLLIIMGIIFLVVYLHQRRKKQKAEVAVHFSNRAVNGSAHPGNQPPPIPSSPLPYTSSEELYSTPQKNDQPRKFMLKNNFSEKGSNCVQPVGKNNSTCSSPSGDSELGACGGSDPERELMVPLMEAAEKTNSELVRNNISESGPQLSCAYHKHGEYVEMNNLTQEKKKEKGVKEDDEKHTYSNVDHRDSGIENLYEVLP